jgi:hypothetical protein
MTKKTKPVFMNSNDWRRQFSEFLRTEREDMAGLPLEECSETTQKQYESGIRGKFPDITYLTRLLMLFLSKANYLPPPSRMRRLFVLWVLARMEHVSEQEGFIKEAASDHVGNTYGENESELEVFKDYWRKYGQEVQTCLQEALSTIPTGEVESTEADPAGGELRTRLPTLTHFPEDFDPLTVIVGGDLNREPTHVGELFKRSQSFFNLHYLLRLNLPTDTEIISDQLLLELEDDEERAKQLLGRRHILVIGSPLVNSVSRYLIRRKKLVFNFMFDRVAYRLGEDFYDDIKKKGLLDTPQAVSMFYRMMEKQGEIEVTSHEFSRRGIDVAERLKIKDEVLKIRNLTVNAHATSDDVAEIFRPTQYFSPFEPTLRHCTSDENNGYAVISIGENFWSSLLPQADKDHKRFALLAVCGTNKLSTAVALKALSTKYKENFRDRPLGGVLKITGSGRSGIRRVRDSTFDWLTQEYKAPELLIMIDDTLRSFKENPDAYAPMFNSKEDMDPYREMVKQCLVGER